MSRVNRQSLKEAFNQIKSKFVNLPNYGKILQIAIFLFQVRGKLFELLLIVFMEKKTQKSNKNTSTPGTQIDKDSISSITTSDKGIKHIWCIDRKYTNSRNNPDCQDSVL